MIIIILNRQESYIDEYKIIIDYFFKTYKILLWKNNFNLINYEHYLHNT